MRDFVFALWMTQVSLLCTCGCASRERVQASAATVDAGDWKLVSGDFKALDLGNHVVVYATGWHPSPGWTTDLDRESDGPPSPLLTLRARPGTTTQPAATGFIVSQVLPPTDARVVRVRDAVGVHNVSIELPPEVLNTAPPSQSSGSVPMPLDSDDAWYSADGLRWQNEDEVHGVRNADMVVLISFFCSHSTNCVQHCFMLRDGQRGMIRYVRNLAVQGAGPTAADVGVAMPVALRKELDEALQDLPSDQPAAKDADTFLVGSIGSDGKWRTRSYDRRHLPTEVRALCRVMQIPETWL